MFILCLVFITFNPYPPLFASAPDILAYWPDNGPGTPFPEFIGIGPCQTRSLRVNAYPDPTYQEYYIWVPLSEDLEVVSLPSYSSIIGDPVYSGKYIIEVYFPASPIQPADKIIVFKLKDSSHEGYDYEMNCLSFYSREPDEYPTDKDIKQLEIGWGNITYISGSSASLEDLVENEELEDPVYSYHTEQTVILNGTLDVDMDYEFGGQAAHPTTFWIYEDSKISISDATLILTGTVLRTCGNIWNGIEVHSAGSLITRHQNLWGSIGRVKINDAINGISLNNGALADIRSTDFLDNRIGIYCPPASSPQTLKSVQLMVTASTFKEDDEYLAGGSHPWAGIELHDMLDFIMPECASTPGSGCSSVIRDAYHGIILDNTSAVVQGIQIRDLNDDPLDQIVTANTGILATSNLYSNLRFNGYGKNNSSSFVNMNTGIRIQNVSAQLEDIRMEDIGVTGLECKRGNFKSVTLKDSHLECNLYAVIYMGNSASSLVLESNDFLLGANAQYDPQYGVLLANNSKGIFSSISIEDNLIDMPNPIASLYSLNNTYVRLAENTIYGGDTDDEYGIRVSGGDGHVIDCNLISNSSDGDADQPGAALYLQMLNSGNVRCNETYDYPKGIEHFGMNLGTPLGGNTFTDHRIGLLYDHEALNAVHNWTGNRWTTDYSPMNGEYGAKNTSTSEIIVKLSKFYFDSYPQLTHGEYGTDVSSNYDWFIEKDEPGSGTLQCGTSPLPTCTSGPGANHSLHVQSPDSLALWVAVDSFSSSIYGLGATWLSHRQLYRILLRNPDFVTTGSVWEDFMENHVSSSVGIYEEIQEGWNNLSELWPTQLANLDSLQTIRDSLQSLTSELVYDILYASTASVADSLRGLWTTGSSSAISIGNDILTWEDDLDSLRLDRLDTLRAMNALAPSDTIWEVAQQNVNDILFQVAISGISSVDSAQMADLLSIAEECPMVIGESVFQARSVLQMLTDTLVWDDDERCSMAITRSVEGRLIYSTLRVYPNPTSASVWIELPGKEEEVWQINLVNHNGSTVASWSLSSGAQQLTFPFLPDGMYTLSSYNAQGEYHSVRLVISR